MNNFIWLDTETTGLNPEHNSVVQIAAVFNDKEFVSYLKPLAGREVSLEALRANRLEAAQLPTFPDTLKVADDFYKFVREAYTQTGKRIMFAGWNVGFDRQFILSLYRGLKIPSLENVMHTYMLDIMPMAFILKDMGKLRCENLKLSTVAQSLGINTDGAHDALVDVKMTMQVYGKLKELINGK